MLLPSKRLRRCRVRALVPGDFQAFVVRGAIILVVLWVCVSRVSTVTYQLSRKSTNLRHARSADPCPLGLTNSDLLPPLLKEA